MIACLDFETTGIDPETCAPVSVAVVHSERGTHTIALDMRINPGQPIPDSASKVHGIYAADVADAKPWPDAAADVLDALDGAIAIVCHNAPYDVTILALAAKRIGRKVPDVPILCTLTLARSAWWGRPDVGRIASRPSNFKLSEVAAELGVPLNDAHTAAADALAVAHIVRPLRHICMARHGVKPDDLPAFVRAEGALHEDRLAELFRREPENRWARMADAIGGVS